MALGGGKGNRCEPAVSGQSRAQTPLHGCTSVLLDGLLGFSELKPLSLLME